MNLYDKKIVKCSECGKAVGEIELDVKIKSVICKKCKKNPNQKELSYNFLNKRMMDTVLS